MNVTLSHIRPSKRNIHHSQRKLKPGTDQKPLFCVSTENPPLVVEVELLAEETLEKLVIKKL
jgi:hypothetical protein